MGGRKRSARVVSFLSIAPPFLNSCSCRTATQEDKKISISHKSHEISQLKNVSIARTNEQCAWSQMQMQRSKADSEKNYKVSWGESLKT